MAEQTFDSQALRVAELRSERVRILGLLVFIAVLLVVLTGRLFLLHTTLYTMHVGWNIALASILAVYEYLMLRLVDRAIRRGENFPQFLWISTTILETSIPAVGIAWLGSAALDAAYRPIASPATLLFFIFIILSILRLNPWICWLAGLTATVSYLVAAVYLGLASAGSRNTRTDHANRCQPLCDHPVDCWIRRGGCRPRNPQTCSGRPSRRRNQAPTRSHSA